MESIYTKENFSNAYAELLEILQYIPQEYLKKIPTERINFYIKNKNYNHNFLYNASKPLKQQNVSKLTKILIANLYIEFWVDEKEKRDILEKDRIELIEVEKLKKQKYNKDDLFKKSIDKNNDDNVNKSLIVKKDSIIKIIINKIKLFFKLT